MNVFVLCTGRCGSTTFIKACEHITNYTAGHETRAQMIGAERINYPDNHIEADNRLAWFLGRVDARFGDDAFYVHLLRERDACARTFVRHSIWQGSLTRAWHNAILKMTPASRLDAARDMVDATNENIRCFLKDKTRTMQFRLENAQEDLPRFWKWVGAEGDLDAALSEFSTRHNRTLPTYQIAKDIGHFAQRALRFYR